MSVKNKNCTFTFRLTEEQKAELLKSADKNDMKVSEYVLYKLFKEEIKS